MNILLANKKHSQIVSLVYYHNLVQIFKASCAENYGTNFELENRIAKQCLSKKKRVDITPRNQVAHKIVDD